MCLIYQPKRKPAFTRLCHRYQDPRGQHVPGEWACGEYPDPAEGQTGTGPGGPGRPRCASGAENRPLSPRIARTAA